MARKTKNRKEARIAMRCTAQEKEAFERCADRCSLDLSEWVRDNCRRAADLPTPDTRKDPES